MEERVCLRPIKEIFPDSISIVDYAFTLAGVDYFEISDFNSMTSDRAFNCLTYYEENKSHCTYDYLMTFSQALDDVLNNNSGIKLTDVVKLNIQLKERLQFLSYAETAYKLCSVVYFDATENPNKYDFVKGGKKAAIFKEKGMSDFFLLQPITKLIPVLNLSANDLREYLEMITLINQKHIQDISTMLSAQSKSSEFYKRLMSQVEKDSV